MDLSNENVIHVKSNGIEYLQFRKLLQYDDILKHAYSLGLDKNFRTAKKAGILSEEEREESLNSYKKLSVEIGINYRDIIKPNQAHTKNIKEVENKINRFNPDFNLKQYNFIDGLITNKSGLILSTTNADCILLLFFDPIKKVIANIHSGWRGTLQKISEYTVKQMIKDYKCNPEDIICCICPSIRKCHFEVSEDVKKLFQNEFSEMEGIIEKSSKENKWYIDTVKININLMKNLGLRDSNIIDSKICSICNKNIIHSYRVEKDKFKLNTALIGLNEVKK